MIVICEKCKKKYRVDPSKINGKAASFKCHACSHVIVVAKPRPISPQTPPKPKRKAMAATGIDDRLAAEGAEAEDGALAAAKATANAHPRHRTGGFGLRAKMLLLFLFMPIILMAGASIFYLWQFETTLHLLVRESSNIVTQLAEKEIAGISAATAMQCKLYLMNHPDLIQENFNTDMGFKTLAVQKVGLRGYTSLYQLPEGDGIWRTWAHIDSKIVGIDMRKLEKSLGSNFPGFWKVYTGVKDGKQFQGHYTWKDTDGKFRDKFMVCTPIDGTRYVIAATTYMDEFTGPVNLMQSRVKALIDKARIIASVILGATFLLIGIIVFVYAQRLTGKIKALTEVAERISVGELEMEVETKSRDEIGELAAAIANMQDSVRLSIERARQR